MALGIVTVGATRRDLVVTIVDENNVPINIASLSLQGRSRDIAATINNIGTVTDGPNGVGKFTSISTLVTQAQLTAAGNLRSATFKLKVFYTETGTAKTDYTDEFELIWEHDPTVLV